VEAHHGAWRLTIEPLRLTLEKMLIMEHEGSPLTLEAHPGVNAHREAWRLTLEPWRFALE
jgi:hypothetical protein